MLVSRDNDLCSSESMLFEYFLKTYREKGNSIREPSTVQNIKSWKSYARRVLKLDEYETILKVINFASDQLMEFSEGIEYTFRVESLKSFFEKYEKLKIAMIRKEKQGTGSFQKIIKGETKNEYIGESLFNENWQTELIKNVN